MATKKMPPWEVAELRQKLVKAMIQRDDGEILHLRSRLEGIDFPRLFNKRLRELARDFERDTGRCPAGFCKCQHCGKVLSDKGFAQHEGECRKNPDGPPSLTKASSPRHPIGNFIPGGSRGGSPKGRTRFMKPSGLPYSDGGMTYSQPATTRSDTYVVQNGLVIFLNSDTDTRDGRIARSGSDSEDYWKGFGVGHPDNGRFGGINGEDYAD